jgi:hypothetical protein
MKSLNFELHSPLTPEECLGRFYALIDQHTHGERTSHLDGVVYYDRIELWLRHAERGWRAQVLMGALYPSEQGTIFKGQVGLSISTRFFILMWLVILCLLIGIPGSIAIQKYWRGQEISVLFYIWPCFVLIGAIATILRNLWSINHSEKRELIELAQQAIEATPAAKSLTPSDLAEQTSSADQA